MNYIVIIAIAAIISYSEYTDMQMDADIQAAYDSQF